jgi:hypothetical protein
MKLRLSPYLAAAACALLAACGGAASQPPAQTATATASAACGTYLGGLYRQMGGDWGVARFQAAVNALSYAGNLPAACGQPLTDAALMHLAAQAAGGH